MSILFTSVPQKILKQSILGSSTTFSINNIKGWDGNDLTASNFGTVGYGAFMSADKTRLEFFEWDASTIGASVINFNKRGLQFDGDLTTEVTANQLDWTANETYVLLGADTSQTFQWLKEYIDGIAIAGSPDMDTTTKGIAEEATQAEVDAKTATGGTSARLAVNPTTLRATKYNDYIVDAVGTDSYAITVSPVITAYAEGQEFTFKAGTANTGGSTLNVCSLGAKPIYKNVSSELITGDILANQIIKVVYDGTNFQLVSIMSGLNPNTLSITRTYLPAASPATWTKPTGLKYIVVEGVGGGGGGAGGNFGSDAIGASGSGAGYCKKKIDEASLGATETLTIGDGGAAGSSGSSPTAGSDGNDTTFGTHFTAGKGKGGPTDDPQINAIGGTATGGDINIAGECSFGATSLFTKGGSSHLGFGGLGNRLNGLNTSETPTGYGSGGCGGYEKASNSWRGTTNGAGGIIIVTEYY